MPTELQNHIDKAVAKKQFFIRLTRNAVLALLLIALSLFIGMLGYRHYEKMSWVDSYVNAAMILSGMGPVSELKTDAGKIFAGSYALFSGILFLVSLAVIIAPLLRYFIHKFHLSETK